MNEQNTKILYSEFPRLYRDQNKQPGESCMHWGFSCGDGWFDLIYKLSKDIETEAARLGLDPASDAWPRAVQVKEKFGTLHFYCDAGVGKPKLGIETHAGITSMFPVANVETINEIIGQAAGESAKICEGCGAAAHMRRDSWWRVTCDKCEAERLEEKRKFSMPRD